MAHSNNLDCTSKMLLTTALLYDVQHSRRWQPVKLYDRDRLVELSCAEFIKFKSIDNFEPLLVRWILAVPTGSFNWQWQDLCADDPNISMQKLHDRSELSLGAFFYLVVPMDTGQNSR